MVKIHLYFNHLNYRMVKINLYFNHLNYKMVKIQMYFLKYLNLSWTLRCLIKLKSHVLTFFRFTFYKCCFLQIFWHWMVHLLSSVIYLNFIIALVKLRLNLWSTGCCNQINTRGSDQLEIQFFRNKVVLWSNRDLIH